MSVLADFGEPERWVMCPLQVLLIKACGSTYVVWYGIKVGGLPAGDPMISGATRTVVRGVVAGSGGVVSFAVAFWPVSSLCASRIRLISRAYA